MTAHITDFKDSEYAIHNHKEIIFVLEDMAKERTTITLDAGSGVSALTSVIKVNAEAKSVFMDISPDNRINEKITDSKLVKFSTQTGVKVRWHSSHLHMVTLPDGKAFSLTIPAVIERIQRRAYFRLNTPQGSKALICKITLDDTILETTVMNMSAEGINVMIKGELPEIFSQGMVLEGCSIDFPEIGMVPLKLKFCGIWTSVKAKTGEPLHRIGMAFVNLSRGASNIVQRHMIQLEKDQITKS